MTQLTTQAEQRLATQRPDQTDAGLLRWLGSLLGKEVLAETRMMFPEGGRPRHEVVGYRMDGLTDAVRDKAIETVSLAMTRTPLDKAQELIVMLHTATASRAEDEVGLSVKMNVYASALTDLPLDVAIQTVTDLSKSSKWFPTLSELVDYGRALANPREALLVSLKRWKPIDPAQAEVERLEAVYRRLRSESSALETKIGPGPASDTGARGERIEAARLKAEEAAAAKKAWLEAQKTVLDDAINT